MKSGIEHIAEERERVIYRGYNTGHDDQHHPHDLYRQAIAYVCAAMEDGVGAVNWRTWDFVPEADPILNLRKAGQLLAAAIDLHQLRRQQATEGGAALVPDADA